MRQQESQRQDSAGPEAASQDTLDQKQAASEALASLGTINTSTSSASLHAKAAMTSVVGSVRWMAPEMISHSLATSYNKKVDVYSFGIVLWELQHRALPYSHLKKPVEIFRAVVSGERPCHHHQSSTCDLSTGFGSSAGSSKSG